MRHLIRISTLFAVALVWACSAAGPTVGLSSSASAQRPTATTMRPPGAAPAAGDGRLLLGNKCGSKAPLITIISLPLTQTPSARRVPLPAKAQCAAAFAVGDGDLFAATVHSGVLAYTMPVTHKSAPAFKLGLPLSTRGIAFGPDGRLFVANDDHPRIDVYKPPFSATSKRVYSFGQAAKMKQPSTLEFDFQLSLFAADCGSSAVLVFDVPYSEQSQPVTTLVQPDAACTAGATVDSGDVLYVTDSTNNRIYIYDPPFVDASQPSLTISGSASLLDAPGGIAIDDNGYLYVANEKGGSLLEFAPPFAPTSAPTVVVKGLGEMMGLSFATSAP